MRQKSKVKILEEKRNGREMLKINKDENSRNNIIPYAKDEFHAHYTFTSSEFGRGGFGIVRKCENLNNRQTYACKTVQKSKLKIKERIEELRMEVYVMKLLPKHSNLVNLIDVFEDHNLVFLVMEYCEGGDLFDLVSSSSYFKEAEAVWIFRKVLEALNVCHARGVVHLDVKPENVFISLGNSSRPGENTASSPKGGIEFKLGDFGQAMVLSKDESALGLAGSSFYMAPEVILGKPYNKAADVWSLGILLYVLLSGNLPFWGKSNSQTLSSVCEGKFELNSRTWNSVSTEAKHLIRWMLSQNPIHRPSTEEIFDHPWLFERNNKSSLDIPDTTQTSIVKELKYVLPMSEKKKNKNDSPHLFERIRRVNSRKIFSQKTTVKSDAGGERKALVVSELLTACRRCAGCGLDLHDCVKRDESQTPFNSVDYSKRELTFCELDDFEEMDADNLCPTCAPIEIDLNLDIDSEPSDSDSSLLSDRCSSNLPYSNSHDSSAREDGGDAASPSGSFRDSNLKECSGGGNGMVCVTPNRFHHKHSTERKKMKRKIESPILNSLPFLWRSLTIWRSSPCPSPRKDTLLEQKML